MRKMIQVPADNENTKDLSLRDLIAPIFRRKRLILVTFFSILILAIVTAAIMGPSYSSRMAILVNRERLDPLVSTQATTQLITADNPVTAEEINSEVELLQSRDVLEKVVVANHLDQPGTFSFTDFLMPWQTQQDRHERAVKKLAKKLKIEAVTKTNLIEISYKSPDPNRSYAVLKSLADFYMSKHVSVHRPVGSYEFFAAQTDKYRKQLEDAEAKLRRFGFENQVAAPEDQKSDLANQVADSVESIYLYGSTDEILTSLRATLTARFPAIRIAGSEPSKFRRLQPQEKLELASRIRNSGASITLVGLGCPKQEVFAYEFRDALSMPILAVGAAFPFIAGLLPQAPAWMQARGMEWVFRLSSEPKRLWRRYLYLNPAYISLVMMQAARLLRFRTEGIRPSSEELYG